MRQIKPAQLAVGGRTIQYIVILFYLRNHLSVGIFGMISRLVVDHIAYLAAISLLGNSSKPAIDYLLILVKLRPDSFFSKIILYCIVL